MFGWDDAISAVLQLATKFIPDPAERDKFALEMANLKAQQETAQLNADTQVAVAQAGINQTEAASGDLFDKWRDFIGWVCGCAFAYHFIIQPLLLFIFAIVGVKIDLPVFDMSTLTTVLLGMLGLGAMHTYQATR